MYGLLYFSVQQQIPKSNSFCPYHLLDACRYGDQCTDIHGEVCDLCGKQCLHPTDLEQRKKHTEECVKEHERDMELSFAVQRSQDKCCGICMDTIFEKESQTDRRFGILENCNHVFCLTCIRKWRSAKQFENKIVRACPECRVCSDFITPSKYWVEAEEDKKKLISEYKMALSTKHCKYFQQGQGECPFAGNCFYLHAYPDGRKAELPPPQPRRHRRRGSHLGSYDDVTSSLLWDFLDERDSRYLVVNIEEMLDIYVNSSDSDSDASDLEFFY
ncbi:E3 ubiquitin-protein ligase makorin-1 [Nymphon striatum]|nr:E3 ubiquitin-protein ligase makorin-1 [Nymphon striatum]